MCTTAPASMPMMVHMVVGASLPVMVVVIIIMVMVEMRRRSARRMPALRM